MYGDNQKAKLNHLKQQLIEVRQNNRDLAGKRDETLSKLKKIRKAIVEKRTRTETLQTETETLNRQLKRRKDDLLGELQIRIDDYKKENRALKQNVKEHRRFNDQLKATSKQFNEVHQQMNWSEKKQRLIPKALKALSKKNYQLLTGGTKLYFPDEKGLKEQLRWIERYVKYMEKI